MLFMGVKGLLQVTCSCTNCHCTVAAKQLDRHYDRCLIKGGKFIGRKYPVPMSLNCQYCNNLRKNANSLRQHEVRCQQNPNKIKFISNFNIKGKKNSNQFTKAKELGLSSPIVTKETITKSIETKRKNGTLKKTKEQRNNTSIAMKRAVVNNPTSYTKSNRGRAKHIVYNGIDFIGQWEVDFYKWALIEDLNPQRPTEGFRYVWNGERLYYPDFYLPILNLYVEVKGYETDRDFAKWNAFTEKLSIVKKNEITEIRNGSFSIDKLLKVCYIR